MSQIKSISGNFKAGDAKFCILAARFNSFIVERLVELLTQYQGRSKLYLVPFAEIQRHIVAKSPAPLRVILYRRAMVRIAERIATKYRAQALVTGENVSQVASQTLTNMNVINDVAQLPILRPLAGDDKMEIIDQARRIGSFEISIEPYEDCCSLFVPAHPKTRARLADVLRHEARVDAETLIQKAVDESVIKLFKREGDAIVTMIRQTETQS